jgi:hypothetical protein
MLFTMSMRMCSFDSSVHGAHNRNTIPNNTHCSSSHELAHGVACVGDTAAQLAHVAQHAAGELGLELHFGDGAVFGDDLVLA